MENINIERSVIVIQFLNLFILFAFAIIFIIILILGRQPTVVQTCPSNACPVNRFTYQKDCENTSYNPAYNECIIKTTCQSKMLPCAIQTDGSSLCPGEPGGSLCPVVNGVETECNCTANRLCPDYIRSLFVPYSFNGQDFFGMATGSLNNNGSQNWNSPLNAGPYLKAGKCTVPAEVLPTVIGKTCLSGYLTKFNNSLYGCAQGSGCGNNQHPVWNYDKNQAECQTVADWPNWNQ